MWRVIFQEKWSVFVMIILAAGLILLVGIVSVSAEELVTSGQNTTSIIDNSTGSRPGDGAFLESNSYTSYRCTQEKAQGICSEMCGTINPPEQTTAEAVSGDAPTIKQIETPARQDNKATIKIAAKPAVPKSTVETEPTGRIGIAGPVYAKTKLVNGKMTCLRENDRPQKSKQNPSGHIDGECCLDPDETPNANCYYPPEKYGNLIQKWLARK